MTMIQPQMRIVAADKKEQPYLILTEIIEFEPGKLPIKTIIRKTADDVSSVSFASDDVFSPKTFQHDIWIQLLDGSMDIKLNDTNHKMTSGECITIPAGVEKTYAHQGSFKLLSVLLKNKIA